MEIKLFNFSIPITFSVSFWTVATFSLVGLFLYFIKNPEKFEIWVSLISKYLKLISSKWDYAYIKYDLQGKINDYLKTVTKKVNHLDVNRINIKWINPDQQELKSYIQNGEMIIRMKKSENQNENLVYAIMSFVSGSLLKKAKSYIAKYQRESLDLYVCYDLLKMERAEILDQFVQDFMKEKFDNEKISDFFGKYDDINNAGIFYPVFIQELTFLGEKVFAKNREVTKIYDEVKYLVLYLFRYANRWLGDDSIKDFNGNYCKFAIRIIGRKYKIMTDGEKVYINNLNKLPSTNETLYLIGDISNKEFLKSVYRYFSQQKDYTLLSDKTYNAIIKDENGHKKTVKSYLMILRNNNICVYNKN